MKKTHIIFFLAALNSFSAFSFPSLENYLKNDLEIRRLTLELQKSELSDKSVKIDNGISVELSTGSAVFFTNGDDTNVSFSPSLKAEIPQASNLGLSLSSKVKISDGEDKTTDTKLSLSMDLISGASQTRKLSLMKSQRELLEAKRELQNRALEAEKEYYSDVKALFESASDIIETQNDLYDDTIDFEEIKAKGYSTSSSKYRQAELKVLSDKHDVEKKIRDLEHDCAVFASKCGETFEQGTNPKDFLPSEIAQVEPVDIKAFPESDYTKIESANYTHEYNSLERSADRNFTLSADGGYTFKNSSCKTSSQESADTVDTSVTAGISGLSLGAGISVPVNGETHNPVYTVSAAFNPSTLRKRALTEKTYEFSEEQELIAIQSAKDDYETDIVDQETSLNDIKWSKNTNAETYDMYSKLEKDLKVHLDSGLITESEYLSSFANKELYRIKLLENDIDLIIWNNTTKLLFCRDKEIQ